ncbi:hypothetical protein NDN08_002451 [Rhodosorus marinus]|uniref:4-alpha-glucanotransferase n=1 Tax=Rhodosorus marinus TaxID=101924 RepID=A0AAV8UTR9_9RHOD|nr:hypothetical protein NDN08_002451 [Rhodosorus marinus]
MGSEESGENLPAEVSVRFCVEFSAKPGQDVWVSGSNTQLGHFNANSAVKMAYEHPNLWTATVTVPFVREPLRYKYLESQGNLISWEKGPERILEMELGTLENTFILKDNFRLHPMPEHEIFASSAFRNVVFRREERKSLAITRAEESSAYYKAMVLGKDAVLLRLNVFAGRVKATDEVCIVGSLDELGGNNQAKAVPLSDSRAPFWTLTIPLHPNRMSFSYRLIIREKSDQKNVIVVEEGEERTFALTEVEQLILSKCSKPPIVFAGSSINFRYARNWKGCGISVPVFSLRSKSSLGVGDFVDLKKIVDFCVKGGYQLLQLLPVHDTTVYNSWRDSYPYSIVSNFALHPQYLNIEAIGDLPASVKDDLKKEKERLNALTQIDYEEVMAVKTRLLRKIYAVKKSEFLVSREFLDFFKENQSWLVPYALFKLFMEINGTADYERWGDRSSVRVKDMEVLAAPDTFHFDYIGMAYFVQFHLNKQLKEASRYAAVNEVVFKGDLPIGVNRYCTDTWVNPHLFRLHMRAGAPPDYFAENGQNWDFPTYNWDEMAKDNYAWWRSRLNNLSKYFHAYRIDHVLGFFRIWEIPERFTTGISGRFYKSVPITREELSKRGLWDMDRYFSPYVHDGILHQEFGNNAAQVRERFFEPTWGDRLKFKEEYNTERKIADELKLPDSAAASEKKKVEFLKQRLFLLMNNVLLLVDEEVPTEFHPRIAFHNQSTYKELSDEWKRQFNELHEEYFYHRQDELWRKEGMKKLPMLKSASNMLVCAEDLGMIPACVPDVIEETSIIGLRVQRMPSDNSEFSDPVEYPYATVATLSSHDTTTFRGWWEEELDPNQKERYVKNILKLNKSAPQSCEPWLAEAALISHIECPSIWCIFPIQDVLAIDGKLRRKNASEERINRPENPQHYWRFRLHLDTETILESDRFMRRCLDMNQKAMRGVAY